MGCGFPALVCFCFSQIDEYEALDKIYITNPNIYILCFDFQVKINVN